MIDIERERNGDVRELPFGVHRQMGACSAQGEDTEPFAADLLRRLLATATRRRFRRRTLGGRR